MEITYAWKIMAMFIAAAVKMLGAEPVPIAKTVSMTVSVVLMDISRQLTSATIATT